MATKVSLNLRKTSELVLSSVNKSGLVSKQVQRVISIANKRYDRIKQDSRVVSPAVDAIDESGGRFRLRGRDWESQKAEYFRAVSFLNQDTSTLGGARSFTNDSINQLFNINVKKSKNPSNYYKYFKDIYNEYASELFHGENIDILSWIDSDLVGQYFYDLRVREARNKIESDTIDSIAKQERIERQGASEIANSILEGVKENF